MSKDKLKILFVCLGNICRSPTAHGVFEKMVFDANLSDRIFVDSAGTSGVHNGELPDSRSIIHAKKRGYILDSISRKFIFSDFEQFDMIFAMDDSNLSNIQKLDKDKKYVHKVRKLTDLIPEMGHDHVPDPYYMGANGFEIVLDIIEAASKKLLQEIQNK